MTWLDRTFGRDKSNERAEEDTKRTGHTHTWSVWSDTSLEWQQSRSCQCGTEQTRNKR